MDLIVAGNLAEVQRLVRAGALGVNDYINDDDATAIATAARYNHTEMVRFFIREGADVNRGEDRGTSAVFWAATRGNLPLVKELVAAPLPGAICRW